MVNIIKSRTNEIVKMYITNQPTVDINIHDHRLTIANTTTIKCIDKDPNSVLQAEIEGYLYTKITYNDDTFSAAISVKSNITLIVLNIVSDFILRRLKAQNEYKMAWRSKKWKFFSEELRNTDSKLSSQAFHLWDYYHSSNDDEETKYNNIDNIINLLYQKGKQ